MKMKRFLHWFQNSFWFHYKWHTLGALFVGVLVILFVIDMVNKENPDFSYIVAFEGYALPDLLTGIDRSAEEVLSDINGDGKVIVSGEALGLDDSQMGVASRVKFTTMLVDANNLVFILDTPTMNMLAREENAFVPLDTLGLPVDDGNPSFLRVDQTPAFQALGLTGDFPLYLCLKQLTQEQLLQPHTQAQMQQAVAFARFLLQEGH